MKFPAIFAAVLASCSCWAGASNLARQEPALKDALTQLSTCVHARQACAQLVGASGIKVVQSFPANIGGVRGAEFFRQFSRRQFPTTGAIHVPREVDISVAVEFSGLTAEVIESLTITPHVQATLPCFVSAQGVPCAAMESKARLIELIRDVQLAAQIPGPDFQLVRVSQTEFLLSRFAMSYSGFPFGAFAVISFVDGKAQWTAFLVFL